MKVKSESEVAQSSTTPRNPMDCSPPGSSVYGISQARVLEWVAIALSLQLYQIHLLVLIILLWILEDFLIPFLRTCEESRPGVRRQGY